MKSRKFYVFAVSVLFGIGTMLPVSQTWAEQADDLSSLTAQWWQWIHSIPYDKNPLNDSNGDNCMVGQRGPIWFLVGTADGKPSNRTCHVPKEVRLLVPAINVSVYNSPNVCGQDSNNFTVKDMRKLLDPFIDAVTNVSISIDGHAISTHRVKSDVFRAVFPIDSFADKVFCKDFGGQPAGIFGPAVDDGFYALIRSLPVGTHTLQSHAESPAFGQDNTYTLIVE